MIKYRSTDVYIEYNAEDRLDLISNRYYNNPAYYFVILHANDYSIEFDIEDGELLRIPIPLNLALLDVEAS